jgi:hypothetical protein
LRAEGIFSINLVDPLRGSFESWPTLALHTVGTQ